MKRRKFNNFYKAYVHDGTGKYYKGDARDQNKHKENYFSPVFLSQYHISEHENTQVSPPRTMHRFVPKQNNPKLKPNSWKSFLYQVLKI